MKKGLIIATCLVASFALDNASAYIASIMPAKRIYCNRFNGEVTCTGSSIDVAIYGYNADFKKNKSRKFDFDGAVAAYTEGRNDNYMIFDYANFPFEWVRLKATNNNVRPDLSSGDWQQKSPGVYVCLDPIAKLHCPVIID